MTAHNRKPGELLQAALDAERARGSEPPATPNELNQLSVEAHMEDCEDEAEARAAS